MIIIIITITIIIIISIIIIIIIILIFGSIVAARPQAGGEDMAPRGQARERRRDGRGRSSRRTYTHMDRCVCIYIYIYICMCVYIYIYTQTYTVNICVQQTASPSNMRHWTDVSVIRPNTGPHPQPLWRNKSVRWYRSPVDGHHQRGQLRRHSGGLRTRVRRD